MFLSSASSTHSRLSNTLKERMCERREKSDMPTVMGIGGMDTSMQGKKMLAHVKKGQGQLWGCEREI